MKRRSMWLDHFEWSGGWYEVQEVSTDDYAGVVAAAIIVNCSGQIWILEAESMGLSNGLVVISERK